MTAERQEFTFSPDWRAHVPIWLILPKTLLFVGVPVWIMWSLVVYVGYWDLYVLFILGAVAVAGGRQIAVSAERAVKYKRKLEDSAIVADTAGLRILPPYGEWRRFPWSEVTELRNTTVGGLFTEMFTTVDAGGVTCNIPAWVNNRKELLRLIRFRAKLNRKHDGWWATVDTRPTGVSVSDQ